MISYEMFMKEWNSCLSDREVLFSSMNLFTILKYFYEYWRSSPNKEFSQLEKNLCVKFKEIIRNSSIEYSLLIKYDDKIDEKLNKVDNFLIESKRVSHESIVIIKNTLDILSSTEFITDIITLIFTVSTIEKSLYLIKFVLRILIEHHSSEFLRKITSNVHVNMWINANNEGIRKSIQKDMHLFENIFELLLIETKKTAKEKLLDETYQSECLSGKWAINLRYRMEEVVQYTINQLSSFAVNSLEQGINRFGIENLIKRISKYYYHICFGYLLNHLHDAPHYDLIKKHLNQNKIVTDNQIFSEFFYNYNSDYVSNFSDHIEYTYKSSEYLTTLYIQLLTILLKFSKFALSSFHSGLEEVIENAVDKHNKDWMFTGAFKTHLNNLFIHMLENHFYEFLKVISEISCKQLKEDQTTYFVFTYFLKIIKEDILGERDRSNKFYSLYRKSKNYDPESLVKFFHNVLFNCYRHYRIFFSIRGFENKEDLIDFGDIKIYNDKWNFFEKISFLQDYNFDRTKINKFKFKICIDVKSNNKYDALILAREKCHEMFANIVFTHKVILNYDKNKKFLPEMETFYGLIDIPLTNQSTRMEINWPIELDKISNDFLKENYITMGKNNLILNSFTWFKEGIYSDSEYSKFLSYWSGLESTIKRIKPKYITKSIFTFIVIRFLYTNHLETCISFVQLFDKNFDSYSTEEVLKKLKIIFREIDDNEIDKNFDLLDDGDMKEKIFSKKFLLFYLYKKRNAITHEGETFSFEISGLELLLEKYFTELILMFKK